MINNRDDPLNVLQENISSILKLEENRKIGNKEIPCKITLHRNWLCIKMKANKILDRIKSDQITSHQITSHTNLISRI